MCWRTLLAFQDVEAGAQRKGGRVRVLGGGLRNVGYGLGREFDAQRWLSECKDVSLGHESALC